VESWALSEEISTFMGSVNKGTEPLYILRMPIPGSAGMGKLIEI